MELVQLSGRLRAVKICYSMKVLEGPNADFAGFARQLGLLWVALHGSRASQKNRPDSDVDVAFQAERGLSEQQLDSLDEPLRHLADIGNKELDVTDCCDAGPVFKMEVAQKGKLLYERASGTFNRFKVQAALEYADTQHFRDMQLDYLRKQYGS